MSIERELLKKVISGDNKGDFFISYDLYKEIYEFLIHLEQTEQEPLSFEDLNNMWCGNPIDFARRIESIHGIGVDDE
jgi:hypothetical protein